MFPTIYLQGKLLKNTVFRGPVSNTAFKNPGHKTSSPILTDSEESRLEDWIITSARKGFPRNKEDILDTVQKFLLENPRCNSFSNNRPGDSWWKAFLKRYPKLTISTSEGVVRKASSYVSELGGLRKLKIMQPKKT